MTEVKKGERDHFKGNSLKRSPKKKGTIASGKSNETVVMDLNSSRNSILDGLIYSPGGNESKGGVSVPFQSKGVRCLFLVAAEG